jgi:hypothetical protein
MSGAGPISRLSQFVTFAACSILLATVPMNTKESSALAQEIQPISTPSLVSHHHRQHRGNRSRYTRQLKAVSGPDNRGRWIFFRPSDVSRNAMQAQGCTEVRASASTWSCRRRTIRVQVSNYGSSSYRSRGYRYSTRELSAESGPDERGRWRFYRPSDVSRSAMQTQGCTDVGTGTISWRCPRRTIRVQVNNSR